ncbi:MAG: S1 family peptidase [Phycisphaerales bacterium]
MRLPRRIVATTCATCLLLSACILGGCREGTALVSTDQHLLALAQEVITCETVPRIATFKPIGENMVRKSLGSGIFLSPPGTMASCHHVIREDATGVVVNDLPYSFVGIASGGSDQPVNDWTLGLLFDAEGEIAILPGADRPFVVDPSLPLTPGMTVIAAGYPINMDRDGRPMPDLPQSRALVLIPGEVIEAPLGTDAPTEHVFFRTERVTLTGLSGGPVFAFDRSRGAFVIVAMTSNTVRTEFSFLPLTLDVFHAARRMTFTLRGDSPAAITKPAGPP